MSGEHSGIRDRMGFVYTGMNPRNRSGPRVGASLLPYTWGPLRETDASSSTGEGRTSVPGLYSARYESNDHDHKDLERERIQREQRRQKRKEQREMEAKVNGEMMRAMEERMKAKVGSC